MKLLSFFGMLTGVSGALLIALNINMFVLGYILFLASSLAWMTYARISKQMNLFILNSVFAIINLIGLINFI